MSVEQLSGVRDRLVPMMELAADQYRDRVPVGYPVVVDNVEQGVVGIELDSSYALYVTTEGEGLYAEIYRRSPRTDNRSSASRQKESGVPFSDRRPLDPAASDVLLRNLIAELMTHFNFQPGIIHISDT